VVLATLAALYSIFMGVFWRRLLLLDEPLSAMDPESRKMIASSLLPSLARSGTTIVMVSHDASFRPEGYTKLVRMNSGRVEVE